MVDAARIRATAAALRREADALEAALLESAANGPSPGPVVITQPAPAPWQPATGKGIQKLDAFFASITAANGLFGARISAEQRAGCLRLCDAGAGVLPLGWMAYLLATAYHEGGHRMVPIREKGLGDRDGDGVDDWFEKYDSGRIAANLGNTPEADGDGAKWCGRGDVQLTGFRNYDKADAKLAALGLIKRGELLANPDLAMRPDLSSVIAVWGMREGWFTGKSFNSYIRSIGNLEQFTNARRIINGTDKAAMIAGYAVAFQNALIAGGWL